MKTRTMLMMFAVLMLIAGCAQNVPMKSSINEFVLMNIKTSSQKGVNFTFSSDLVGTKLPLYGKDMKPFSGMVSYNADETTTLRTMFNEYLQNKFFEIDPSALVSIDIKLDDFYVEYYTTDSVGTQILQGLAEMPSNYLSSAKLALIIRLNINGNIIDKRLTASTDVTTSGNQSVNGIGDSINQVNNKMLMLVNAFLAENGL